MTESGKPESVDLYASYVAFAEASRAAVLQKSLAPESEISLCNEPVAISREDFDNALKEMEPARRTEFIRRITVGYTAAMLIHGDRMANTHSFFP